MEVDGDGRREADVAGGVAFRCCRLQRHRGWQCEEVVFDQSFDASCWQPH